MRISTRRFIPFFCLLVLQSFYLSTAQASVKFVHFAAEQVDEEVHLEWETTSEVNSYAFKIQRLAINGGGTWYDIGLVYSNASFPGSTSSDYTFEDMNPAAGEVFYRLKQIDFDGTITYSDKISLEVNFLDNEMGEVLSVYPNPAIAEITVAGPVISTDTQIQLLDITGRILAVEIEAEDRQIRLRPRKQLSGVYILTIRDAQQQYIKKIRFK